MLSRNNLQSDYQQKGGICLLASYSFILEYAGVFHSSNRITSAYYVFEEYLLFHNTLDKIQCISANDIEKDKIREEGRIGDAINVYCQSNGNIAGYQQIARFHDYLKKKRLIQNIEIIDIQPPTGADRSKPISNAYDFLEKYLQNDANGSTYAVLILYQSTSNRKFHTVFLGYDGDFFIRDSNDSQVSGNTASFGFTFDRNSIIYEYMVFKIN